MKPTPKQQLKKKITKVVNLLSIWIISIIILFLILIYKSKMEKPNLPTEQQIEEQSFRLFPNCPELRSSYALGVYYGIYTEPKNV